VAESAAKRIPTWHDPATDYCWPDAAFGVIFFAAYLLIGVPWFAVIY
jgi:hypothetical protein